MMHMAVKVVHVELLIPYRGMEEEEKEQGNRI